MQAHVTAKQQGKGREERHSPPCRREGSGRWEETIAADMSTTQPPPPYYHTTTVQVPPKMVVGEKEGMGNMRGMWERALSQTSERERIGGRGKVKCKCAWWDGGKMQNAKCTAFQEALPDYQWAKDLFSRNFIILGMELLWCEVCFKIYFLNIQQVWIGPLLLLLLLLNQRHPRWG